MANEKTFNYRLVKISLIVLNSMVIIGLTFGLLMIGHHLDPALVVVILLGVSNFALAIVGVIRESRTLVMTTGSVTLMIVLMAVFNRTQRHQNSTFSLLYFLAIVLLSFTFSSMLKERQLRRLRGRTSRTASPNAQPFTTVVVYQSPTPQLTVSLPTSMPSTAITTITPDLSVQPQMSAGFKDPPPPYDDCPPPKYEEVESGHK